MLTLIQVLLLVTCHCQLFHGTSLHLVWIKLLLSGTQIIRVISTKPDLSRLRTITVDEDCRGICSTTDNDLLVTFIYPGKVQVLDEHGTVLCEMGTRADSKPQLNYPLYLLVVTEKDKEILYVSDQGTHTITKFSMTGQILLTYKDSDLKWPRGLAATDDGHVLVCGYTCHNVQVVSMSGKKVRTLLCEKNGIIQPQATCHNIVAFKLQW